MSEQKLSDFIMFEKAPYEKLDTKSNIEVYIRGAKEKEKVYGTKFTTMFIKYALKAVSNQIGRKTPEDSKTLDQLTDYLISVSDELRTPPYSLVLWAHFVTDKKLENSQEKGTQIMYRGIAQSLLESEGESESPLTGDVDQILETQRKLAVDMKIAPLKFGYKKNVDGSIDVFHGGCFFFEGCQISWEQGLLKRLDSRLMCGASMFICQFLKMGTGYEWDHAILEFDKSHCIVTCFPI